MKRKNAKLEDKYRMLFWMSKKNKQIKRKKQTQKLQPKVKTKKTMLLKIIPQNPLQNLQHKQQGP